MTRLDVAAYRHAYYIAHRDAMLARAKARHRANYVPVPPDQDRRFKTRLNTGLATGTLPEQVRALLLRGYRRHQIAALLGVSRARVTQILNGRTR